MRMKKAFYLVIILAMGTVVSCKKDKNNNNGGTDNGGTTTGPSKTGSTLDLIRDSVFFYAKEDYYWYDGLPSYAAFNPRSYSGSTDIDALTSEVDAISQYKINP